VIPGSGVPRATGRCDRMYWSGFPPLQADGLEGPAARFQQPQAALAYAQASLATNAVRWVNHGPTEAE